MENKPKLEVWLRGPLPNIPPFLQPIAHAILQVQEELNEFDKTFPSEFLWQKPAGLASVGFHMQHLAGVLDRLLTYARGESLTQAQFHYLRQEGQEPFPGCTFKDLLEFLNKQISVTIEQLKNTDSSKLLEVRSVGRSQIPSTHFGLLVHAAEHTTRHFGQLLVTYNILLSNFNGNFETRS